MRHGRLNLELSYSRRKLKTIWCMVSLESWQDKSCCVPTRLAWEQQSARSSRIRRYPSGFWTHSIIWSDKLRAHSRPIAFSLESFNYRFWLNSWRRTSRRSWTSKNCWWSRMIRGQRLLETCFGTSWQKHQWPTWMDRPPTGPRESTTPSSLDQAFRMPSRTNNSSEESCPSTSRMSLVVLMRYGDSLRSSNNRTLLSRTSKEPSTSLKMTNNKFSPKQRMFCSRTLARIGRWFSSRIN